ncbi:TPA: AraC family transcriptional regulator, partial [Raoultella planticola]
MSRPSTLYVPHVLSAADIAPEERYQRISQNLSCYGIEVVNNRRPAEIVAHHKTISAISGDYCSAMGS